MTKNTKVSVLLTSYNHEKYLREAIDSILNQTFSDFELIIVDDASTDESWQIISSYSDLRIRSFRSEVTTKAGGDLRKAISEVATGEYIAIHHSDDVWELQKLEKQVDFLKKNPQIGAVFSNALIIGENGELFEDKSHVYYSIFNQPNRNRYEWLNYFFHHGNALCHPSVLIRKICYQDCGLYRYGLAQTADFDMWVRLCLKYEIYILPEKLVRFRVRSNEMNSSGRRPEVQIRRRFELMQVLNNYRKILTFEELTKVFPTIEKYLKPEGFDLDFALGMVALEEKSLIYTELFGLIILFEALNDPQKARKIRELYDFNNSDFIALTAKHDVFSTKLIADLNAQVVEKERLVQDLLAQVAEKDRSIAEINEQNRKQALIQSGSEDIVNSRARKLILEFRKIRYWLMPVNSLRERIAHSLYKAIKSNISH